MLMYPLKMVIFHSDVSLPEGRPFNSPKMMIEVGLNTAGDWNKMGQNMVISCRFPTEIQRSKV